MKIKTNPILEQLEINRGKKNETREITVINYGAPVTLNIKPMSFLDSMRMVSQARAGGGAKPSIKLSPQQMQQIQSGAEISNELITIDLDNDGDEGLAILNVVAKHVVEIAGTSAADLSAHGVSSHVELAEMFFDSHCPNQVYKLIMEYTDGLRKKAEAETEAAVDIAKN